MFCQLLATQSVMTTYDSILQCVYGLVMLALCRRFSKPHCVLIAVIYLLLKNSRDCHDKCYIEIKRRP